MMNLLAYADSDFSLLNIAEIINIPVWGLSLVDMNLLPNEKFNYLERGEKNFESK